MLNSFFIFFTPTILFLAGLIFLPLVAIALWMFTALADARALSTYVGATDVRHSVNDCIPSTNQACDIFVRCRVMCAYQIHPTIPEQI